MSASVIIRPAKPDELAPLVSLCAEHAAFEQSSLDTEGLSTRLQCLFQVPPSLYAWVAVSESALIGYATATIDFSTWRGAHFVHMDCLYVQQLWRGSSIGNQLINAIKAFATAHQLCEIQWQTPLWNQRAAKFYQGLGAEESIKRRFKLCTA